MDLTPAEVVGHTCYHFIHVEDLENLRQSHEDCKLPPEAHAVYKIDPHPLILHMVWNWGAQGLKEPVETSFSPVVEGALCCHHPVLPNQLPAPFLSFSSRPVEHIFLCIFHRSPASAEERPGSDGLLSLAPEERRLPVDPVQCHCLHQPQSPPRTQHHLGQLCPEVSRTTSEPQSVLQTADMFPVYMCWHHTVSRDPLKG